MFLEKEKIYFADCEHFSVLLLARIVHTNAGNVDEHYVLDLVWSTQKSDKRTWNHWQLGMGRNVVEELGNCLWK